MDDVAVLSVIFGALIIISRAPLIVAPQATLDFYRRLFDGETSGRVLGACLTALGVIMIRVGWSPASAAAALLLICGVPTAFIGATLLVYPEPLRRFYLSFFDQLEDAIDPPIMRLLGVLAVTIGAWIIWLGAG